MWRRLFVLLVLLGVGAELSAQPSVVVYGNGVRNTKEQAWYAMEKLQAVVEADSRFSGRDLRFDLAYNQTSCRPGDGIGPDLGCILDIRESFVQLVNPEEHSRFWLLMAGLGLPDEQSSFERLANRVANPGPFISDLVVDLVEQAAAYDQHIRSGMTVALVAHSQGNLFGNNVYELLETDEQRAFGMVSVATPADNVLGDESLSAPYVLLGEDPIRRWYVPFPTFPWNVTNGGPVDDPSWLFHGFVDSYLTGIVSKERVLTELLRVLDTLELPSTCLPLPAGAISFWSGDGHALDTVGNNDGTLLNGAGFGEGKVGQAFSLEGEAEYILISDSPSLRSAGPYTFEFWFRSDETLSFGLPKGRIFFRKGFFNSLGVENNGAHIELRGPQPRLHSVTNTWEGGVWYHVALTFTGSAYALYVNSELETVLTNQPYSILNNFEAFFIGGNFMSGRNSAWWNGEIDELTLYDRVLSAQEIQDIYLADTSGKCRP